MVCWEGTLCGDVVLESCVLCLEVASYVWPDVCSELLQMVSGLVLCGSSCAYVGHWVGVIVWK